LSADRPKNPRPKATSAPADRSSRHDQGTATVSAASRPIVAGVALSHPDRLIYPELGLSKFDLARYYEAIAEWVVPHLIGRPLTLLHCPRGMAGPCLFMKHAKQWGPDALRRVRIQEKTKIGEYLVADSISAVVALVQMGVVEVHTWNSTTADLERPNRIVWDLDPGPAVTWPQVVTAARLVQAVLKTLGLAAWVKTTGGRGLHIVVPIKPTLEWTECLAYARAVSEVLVRANPQMYTTTYAKRGRERKILLDYLRNNRTNTSVCAFSPRAREGAPVSVPVAWRELSGRPERWTLQTVPRRLRRLRSDPWAGYWTSAQTLSRVAIEALRSLEL
jgi:bifunctional non-homologous end joining protein LigD